MDPRRYGPWGYDPKVRVIETHRQQHNCVRQAVRRGKPRMEGRFPLFGGRYGVAWRPGTFLAWVVLSLLVALSDGRRRRRNGMQKKRRQPCQGFTATICSKLPFSRTEKSNRIGPQTDGCQRRAAYCRTVSPPHQFTNVISINQSKPVGSINQSINQAWSAKR